MKKNIKKTSKIIAGSIQSKSQYTELQTNELRWNCPEDIFEFQSTKDVEPLDAIVGQPRAIEAIKLGAELFTKGYNIFVSGLSGTGRLTTVKRMLEEVTTSCPMTFDYCYVNNFENQDAPRLIKLPRGQGKKLSTAMKDSITYLRRRLPKLFEEENFKQQRIQIIEDYQQKEHDILNEFDTKIKPFGFVRGQLENENGSVVPEVFPVIEDKPIQITEIDDLVEKGSITKEKADEIKKYYRQFHNEIFDLANKGLKLMQDFRNDMLNNEKAAAAIVVTALFNDIIKTFSNEKVEKFVEEVKDYILNNLSLFFPQITTQQPIVELNPEQQEDTDKFSIFEVNVVLDNSQTTNYPIVVETTPSYTNLFGTIERTLDPRGFWRTDFTKIKAGSILKADQGYLIVNALDLFTEQGVWQTLKRVLLYDKLEIQPFESLLQFSQLLIKPEPIDINVKVILIGGGSLYRMLYLYEKGFKKIFKVNAQFDYETERNPDIINNYTRFIAKICKEENLPHCTPDGVAAIIEWAVENAGSQNRITLKFSDVADILRESAFFVRNSFNKYINREDVKIAIKNRKYRNDLLDEKIKQQILENNLLIDTEGERVGQINGLTVLNTGILSFGKPARITATIAPGTAGIINIEREAEMSGAIHSKGMLIITGFIRERFAKKEPLTFTASIAFEQSYSGVDGDSASAAEIYVLLSALTNIPIKQTFAITGSINQKGDIQPIGGVNEKITGFYEICKERGFKDGQGVIIPVQNVKDLMLSDELIEDVKQGNFKIYSFAKIEDATPLLFGLPAGEMDKKGNFPEGSLFALAAKRFSELRQLSKDKDDKKTKEKKKTITKRK